MAKTIWFAILMSVAVAASAADISSIAHSTDPGATVERDGSEVTIVTSAQRVTPHDPPYTTLIGALCEKPDSLVGINKVIMLSSHAFKGVEFWTYDETDDLAGTCGKVAGGDAVQSYSVMH